MSHHLLTFISRSIAIGFIEFAIVHRFAPFRPLFRAVAAKRLRALQPYFEPDFYLAQIQSPARRKRASHDPLAHYLTVGWQELRSPNRRFDPRFYKDDVERGRVRGEPLLHLLARPDKDLTPQNEVEARRAGEGAPSPGRRRALVFHHARGGGSSKFLALFEEALREQAYEPLCLRLLPKSDRIVVWPGPDGSLKSFDIFDDFPELLGEARRAGIELIVINHLIDFDGRRIFSLIDDLASGLGCPFWVVLHDYYCLCPRVNLIDSGGKSCDVPDQATCETCVRKSGSAIGRADATRWRGTFLAFLERSTRVLVPSEDMRARLSRYIAHPLEVWSPQADIGYPDLLRPRVRPGEKLAVAVLGSLNYAKGSTVVLDLARRVAETNAPIHITVFGEAENTRALKQAGVVVRGRYKDDDLSAILAAASPHVVLLPAVWPETWSFVLTAALEDGLPVMAFDHGAPSDRLKQLGRGDLLLPLDWVGQPDKILARLLAFREEHRVD